MGNNSSPRANYHKDLTADVCLNCKIEPCTEEDGAPGNVACPFSTGEVQAPDKPWEGNEKFISLKAATEHLGISTNAMYKRLRNGQYPGAWKDTRLTKPEWRIPACLIK